ncbi:cell division protein FtsQ/DivIB [Loigolactobacillus zhaoyuanensis]|uniref:Cell division protein DivIB n=1 Tax=Loigolactobacillus zhaoyuanensis TaxID=2486017 RepID=A0ABW8UAI3_9LACO|nr:cell division protein FtsQ/DivIB [Loigolactobacillus zhaoyuanensis]
MAKKWIKRPKSKSTDKDPASALTPWEAYQQQQKTQADSTTRPEPTIEHKLPRLKELRRKHLVRRLTFLLSILVIILIIAGYFMSPLSKVGLLSVTSDQQSPLSEQTVIDASGIKTSDSVVGILLKQRTITKKMTTSEPKIKSATLAVQNFRDVKLKIKTYKTVGLLVRGTRYYPILENGVIAKDSTAQPTSNHSVYSHFKSGAKLQQMIKQARKLPSTVRNGISEIQFTPTKLNPERVHLYMNDGNQVYATISTFAKKMQYYPNIAKEMQKKGTVNLEVGAYSYPF